MVERQITIERELTERPIQVERENLIVNNIDKIEGVFPAGTKEIAENGTYDVTVDKYVDVNLPTLDSYFDFEIDSYAEARNFFQQRFLKSVPDEEFVVGEAVDSLYYAFANVYTPLKLVLTGGSANLTSLEGIGTSSTGLISADLSKLTTSDRAVPCSLGFRYDATLESVVMRMPLLGDIAQIFRGCTALKTVDLRETQLNSTSQGNVFAECSALEKVMLGGTRVWSLTTTSFRASAIEAGTCLIYVPDSLVAAYKADSVWGTYADQIKPLSELPEEE